MENLYEVNSKTCALIALSETKSEIIEKEKIFIVDKPTLDILKDSCEYYGSTYEGRMLGSKKQLGMRYKLPIMIESSNDLIMFPTSSANNENCCWIALNNITSYEKQDNNVIIKFNGNIKQLFHMSLESLENQIFRATKLMLLMRNRRQN